MPYFQSDEELYESFKDVCRRERIDIGKKINELIIVYVKEHGDGNPNFELDLWVDNADARAIPAVSRTEQDWKDYLNVIDDNRAGEDYRKLEKLALLAQYRVEHGDANVRVI